MEAPPPTRVLFPGVGPHHPLIFPSVGGGCRLIGAGVPGSSGYWEGGQRFAFWPLVGAKTSPGQSSLWPQRNHLPSPSPLECPPHPTPSSTWPPLPAGTRQRVWVGWPGGESPPPRPRVHPLTQQLTFHFYSAGGQAAAPTEAPPSLRAAWPVPRVPVSSRESVSSYLPLAEGPPGLGIPLGWLGVD